MPAPKRGLSVWRIILTSALFAWASSSCSSLQVPVFPPLFHSGELTRGSSAGIEVAAKAIEGREDYWDLFDDYLPEIGIAAVWVILHNTRRTEIHLASVKWELLYGEHRRPAISISELFKSYHKGRRIRVYGLNADEMARREMSKIVFYSGPVPPSGERRGFVFFRIDPQNSQHWTRGGMLFARGKLPDEKQPITIKLPLAYANP